MNDKTFLPVVAVLILRNNTVEKKIGVGSDCLLLFLLFVAPCFVVHNLLSFQVLQQSRWCALPYTTFTNFSMKYHLMCKVYTDVGGIK